jgi:alpha-galactosidase
MASNEVLLSDGQTRAGEWRLPEPGVVQLVYRNASSAVEHVEQLRPIVSPSGYRDLPVQQLHIAQTGWQSWSRSHPLAPFESNAESAVPPIRGPHLPHRRADSEVVPWMALLAALDGDALLLGFLSAEHQLGTIEIAPAQSGHHLMAATEVEGISLAPGEEVVSEPLLILTGNPAQLVEMYAQRAARQMRARQQDDVLSGWCSWYQLYTSVSEADVRRNVATLAEHRDEVPLKLIQIDDGFERQIGDWLSLHEDKFPSGMPALVDDIKHAGFVPGLWLAPFLVSANSRTFAEHPEWLVHDERGEPVLGLHNWGAANYALDTTHPDALDWIAQVVHTVVNEWGFDYLKLDFLYAAALRGRRFDPHATSVEAYRRGLARLREAAGEGCFILGCGAPLLPSVGLVDGMRIGSDVAAYWGREGNADGPALLNALRATLARGWLHGRWWANDPDCVVLRASDTQLTASEVEAWASVVALSGGMLFIGDDVSQVEPERLRVLARLIPPSGQAATVGPPLVNRMPERLHLRIERPWGGWSVVGIANWRDEPARVAFEPSEFGLAPGRYHLTDLWSGDYLGPADDPGVAVPPGSGELPARDLGELPAHGLRLLPVHADAGRPRTIGSTGHLLGDAMDLADEHWDPASRTLTLTPSGAGPPARAAAFLVVDDRGQVQRVPFTPTHTEPIRVSFPA